MTMVMLVIALLWVLALAGARAAERDPRQRLDPAAAAAPAQTVDVVVPARNEERNIAALLETLLAQDFRPRSIVVVDDASSDGTAAIVDGFAARDARVRRVAGSGPPPDWTGKTAALDLGVRSLAQPPAQWVLFVDADVRLAPAALRSALAETIRRHWEGISLWGRWEVPSLGGRLLQSVIGGFVRGAHPIPKVNDPSKRDAFLNGQLLLIRREAYDALDGWGSVRSEVLEDVALARRAKRRGVPIGLLRAPALMTVVPYRSFGEAWRGYRKNFVAGAGGSVSALAAAAAVFVASIAPFVLVAVDIARGVPSPWRFAAAVTACAAAVLYRAGTARFFHHPAVDALLHPFANAAFVLLILSAVWGRVSGGGAEWKGRVVR